MLEVVTGPVTVTGYRQGEKGGQPMTRRDGTVVEFVKYRAEGDPADRETVLDASINGNRVDPGTVCRLVLDSRLEAKALPSRDGGNPFVVWREKQRVMSFAKAA